MVRKLSPEIRRRVVELWLDDNTYEDIHAKLGVSSGASSKIISETRKKAPDIDELRRLNIALGNADANLDDALSGALFLLKLNQLNIQIDRIPSCISLLDRYGEKAGEVLESGRRLKELEASHGKTYEQIIDDAARKVKQQKDAETRLEALRREEENIKSSLPDLERLKALYEKIGSFGLKLEHLDWYINQSIKLQQLGFTSQTAELLASELAKLGLNPQMAAAALANLLSKYGSLVTAVAKLQEENDRLEKDVETKTAQREGIMKQLEALTGQLDDYRRLIKDEEASYRKRTDQLEKEYGLKQKELEEKIRDLEEEREYVVNSIQESKKESEAVRASHGEAQAALTNIEEKLTKTRPLGTFSLLTEEPESRLEPSTLLKVSIGFIDALKAHIHARPELVSDPRALRSKLEEISRTLAVEHRLGTRKLE